MNLGPDDSSPSKKAEASSPASFVTSRWFQALLASFSGVCLVGYVIHLLHIRHGTVREHVAVPLAQTRQQPPPPDAVERFRTCNPLTVQSLFLSAREFQQGQQIVPTLEGPWCNSEQAAVIRQVLDDLKFEYEAIVPHPYIYPAHVQEALKAMSSEKLRSTLENFERQASSMGRLGSLVKFFAWGLPVHAQELWAAFGGDDVVEALTRCSLLTKCASHSPMYVSAVQLFPIQRTPIIVATDWASHSPRKMHGAEQPVEAIDLHTLFLAHNTPVSTGLRVLELGSSASGALGLVAASRGATEVAILDPSARGSRFARFNTWLNLMGNTVEVIRRHWADAPIIFQPGFYLMLMHPSGTQHQKEKAIKLLLQLSKTMLSSSGSIVLGFEGRRCDSFIADFNAQFCGDDQKQGDLTGTAVCRRPSDTQDTTISQEGIVYGWRSLKEALPPGRRHCGHFNTVDITSLDSAEGPRACSYSRLGMTCPFPDDPPEVYSSS